NNRTAVGEASGDRVTWTYDDSSQLTSEHRSGAHAYRNTFVYDPVGNRLVLNEDGARTTTIFDAANQIEHSDAAAGRTTYTFDADGNQQIVEEPNNDRTTNVWDYENRLTAVQLPTGTNVTMTYLPENLRVTSDDGTSSKTWLWDDQNYLSQTDGGLLVFTNTPNQYGNVVSQNDGTSTSWYHFDARGDTSELTDAIGVVTNTRLYDAWGNVLNAAGATEMPFQFGGVSAYLYNKQSNRCYVRDRYYGPSDGRWESRDPAVIRWSLQLYAYVLNSPIQHIDPTGRDEQIPFEPPIDLRRFIDLLNEEPFRTVITPVPLTPIWNVIDIDDQFGRRCCGKDLCKVMLYVTKPCRSAAKQIAANLLAGQAPMKGVKTGHTWIAGNCGVSRIASGLWPLYQRSDGSARIESEVGHENLATHVEEFEACPESFEALETQIQTFKRLIQRRQAWYSLTDPDRGDNIFNCTSWACEMLERSGVSFPEDQYFDPFVVGNRPGMKELKKCIKDQAAQ
ncbi:MAG: RHS repeat-associated core domain-containing protein, partial [Parvibaculaceae bacterium]